MVSVINTQCSNFAVLATERSDCKLGGEDSEASPSTVSGQYLDHNRPFTCSQGHLTAWHYCFYTSTITESGIYQAFFRVWRPTTQSDFTLIHSHHLAVPINHNILSTNTTLRCDTEVLEADEYVSVLRGDILGVYMPNMSPLYVTFTGGVSSRIYYDTRGQRLAETEKSVSVRSLRESPRLGIHLYADIGT